MARLVLPNSTNMACRVIDLSRRDRNLTGFAAPVGVVITIEKTQGIEGGFAIEFMRLQQP